ncbi:hypothetical protein M011DRAFT_489009 [Sporormia fimetaria CBS 119925]|uniref:Uncharacterized protein n=1 Tax=Sporormia fimetaria CBS 119925 TaxID=1340428 RepID=A0A6A6V320_9PLEO|nr:hypothetical protein M011DRAFT_489009 [Sporormia fimetaria CBS 119925]
MAGFGTFSSFFLPLSSAGYGNKFAQTKTMAKGGKEETISTAGNGGPHNGGDAYGVGVHVEECDDEWYDATTSEEGNPAKKSKDDVNRADSVVSVQSASPLGMSERQSELLQYMPSLFDTARPPCNADIQIAYEIVNTRLRSVWLEAYGRKSVVDTCELVRKILRNQDRLVPMGTAKGPDKRRRPWCREIVWLYQLRWADYFVREAKAMVPLLMTESEYLEGKKSMPVVPPELQFDSLERHVPEYVLEQWKMWNEKKRGGVPSIPGVQVQHNGIENSVDSVKTPQIDGGMRGGGDEEMKADKAINKKIANLTELRESLPSPDPQAIEGQASGGLTHTCQARNFPTQTDLHFKVLALLIERVGITQDLCRHIADEMNKDGHDCTPRAVDHRLHNIKKSATKGTSSPGTPSTPRGKV